MKRHVIAMVLIMTLLVITAQVCSAETSDKKTAKPKPPVTFIELGSVSCVPCKMMKPVMAEIEKEYGDSIAVVFYDVSKDKQKASDYKIRVIPTQVFLDNKGKEFYRHEGFFPREEIMQLVDKQLGIKRAVTKDDEEKTKHN